MKAVGVLIEPGVIPADGMAPGWIMRKFRAQKFTLAMGNFT